MEPVATEDNVVKWTLNQLFLDKKAASGGPTSTQWPKIFHYFNTNHGVTILSRPVMIRHTWFACTLPSPPCACRRTQGQSSATSRDPTAPGQNHAAPTGLPVRRIDQFSVPGLSSMIGPGKNFPVLMRPELKTLISDGHPLSRAAPQAGLAVTQVHTAAGEREMLEIWNERSNRYVAPFKPCRRWCQIRGKSWSPNSKIYWDSFNSEQSLWIQISYKEMKQWFKIQMRSSSCSCIETLHLLW